MPSYTRGSRNAISETRGKSRDGIFRRTTVNRPGLNVDRVSQEPFIGVNTMNDPNRKLVYGNTDDRGRAKSAYYTDERGRLKIPYACMYEYTDIGDAATTITLTDTATYYGWVTATAHEFYGDPYVTFENNATADRIRIGADGAGIWKFDFSSSCHSGGGGPFYLEFEIFVNDVGQDSAEGYRYLSGTNDLGSFSTTSILALEGGDYVDMRFRSPSAANKDLDIHYMNLNGFRINHKR